MKANYHVNDDDAGFDPRRKFNVVRHRETGDKLFVVSNEPHVVVDDEGREHVVDGYAGVVDDCHIVRGLPWRVGLKLVAMAVTVLWVAAAALVLLGTALGDVFLLGGALRVAGYALFWWGVQHIIIAPIPDKVPSWAQMVLSWGATLALFFLTHGLVPR